MLLPLSVDCCLWTLRSSPACKPAFAARHRRQGWIPSPLPPLMTPPYCLQQCPGLVLTMRIPWRHPFPVPVPGQLTARASGCWQYAITIDPRKTMMSKEFLALLIARIQPLWSCHVFTGSQCARPTNQSSPATSPTLIRCEMILQPTLQDAILQKKLTGVLRKTHQYDCVKRCR